NPHSTPTTTNTGTVIVIETATTQSTANCNGGHANCTVNNLGASTHLVTASYSGDSNYNPSPASSAVSQVVNKAPLSITADPKTKVYGEPNPAFTVSYFGFVLGQGPDVLGGTLSFATAASTASTVGSYSITPSGLTS